MNPNDFSCIQDYLSKYKTLRLLCVECKIKKEEKQCIYHILSKLGLAYFVFVSTFYSMKESLTTVSYQEHSLESFCDSLIREQDKLIQLGMISTTYRYGRYIYSLVISWGSPVPQPFPITLGSVLGGLKKLQESK